MEHREEMWDYRSERCEEIWDNAGDFYDDVFDDNWWGNPYGASPWWWWAPATIGAVGTFVNALVPDPVYIDYGANVVYQGETVQVNGQSIPAQQYIQPIIELAVNVEQPPLPQPPPPPAPGAQTAAPAPAEWMPLGVFALAQEEKGEPVMFFQISVNRDGIISGAYSNVLSKDEKPIAGQIDKATQRVAWRIGDSQDAIFETSVGNLTLDVAPLAIHFGKANTQTWLLVRMPQPAAEGQEQIIPTASKTPPPLPKKAN